MLLKGLSAGGKEFRCRDLDRKDKIRISQCMIVKNEESYIERALSWGKRIMWEQIVVDTGSTDRTVEIAAKMGAKVFRFSWIDDFAAAKNYAIEQAEGDWIALLDADEYMTEQDGEKLVTVLQEADQKGMDGLSMGWQQIDEEGRIFSSGTQVRVFRNHPDIRYRRRIHEQLESVSGRKLRLGDVVMELSVFHTGYQSKAMAERKASERNRHLILEELKDHPNDYEMLGYMGDEYYISGNMKEAERWYTSSIAQMPLQIEEYDQRSAVTLARALSIALDKEGALWEHGKSVYQRAVKALPKEADFDYIAAQFFAGQGQASQAVKHLELAFEKLNVYGCSNKALLLAAELVKAYDLMVRCCYESGETNKCVTYGVNYLRFHKYGMAVLSRLLRVLDAEKESNRYAVIEFLLKIYDRKDIKDRLFIIKTAEKSGCREFAGFVAEQLFTPDERKQLGILQ